MDSSHVVQIGFVPTYVYRLFTADSELLYVGCTRHLDRRLAQHRKDRGEDWALVGDITVEVYGDRYVAENVERIAILRERPRWNRMKAYPSPRMSDDDLVPHRSPAANPSHELPTSVAELTPAAEPESKTRPLSRVESQDAIYEALARFGRPVMVRDLMAAVGRSDELVRIRLGELVEQGRAERIGERRWIKYRSVGSADGSADSA